LSKPLLGLLGVLGVLGMASRLRPGSSPSAPAPAPASRSTLRDLAVRLGLQEFERVNEPGAPEADPADYWAVAAQQPLSTAELARLDWCGGFYLWVLKVAGIAPANVFWRFDGTGIASAKLRLTNSPEPGDLAYFKRNQHHALIEAVDGDTIRIINGNGGGKGITRSSVSRRDVAAFYSIDPLLAGRDLVA